MREPISKLAYSVEEFAHVVGLSRNHAYALVRGGEVRAVKAGSRWIIPIKAVERWLEGQESRDTSSKV
ncbi:helix-turn-helix domain-containing protein [Meiothermus granaticius]|uniref:helix-turn-helix domain-containing protein n=1 Tax=Meiothermus granaticius TaxID=863370 RepID=UPI000E650DC4|nr:helix-turn-helix domain-containing protein [Thermaceae bacterium]